MENNHDIDARRAALQAELSVIALAGGNTAPVREKLAKLDAREQEARAAEAARREADRAQRLRDAREHGARLGADAVARLVAAGHEVTEPEEQHLVTLGQGIGMAEVELRLAHEAHAAATERVQGIRSRLSLLEERSRALSGLRITGQAGERDIAEATLIEKDLQTLRDLLSSACASADAVRVPADIGQRRQNAMNELASSEKAITVRSMQAKVAHAERELLERIRQLVSVSGATHPSNVYRRGQPLDRFFRMNIL